MKTLSTDEIAAMRAWMEDQGLSLTSSAKLIGVNSPNSTHSWLNGGGIRPAQRSALLKLITPYLKPDDQFRDATKMVPAEIRPSLRPIYAKLCELEDRSPVAVKAAEMHLEAMSLIWPATVKESLPVAPASKGFQPDPLLARPKTTPPELRIVRPLDDLPMMEAAAGTGREGAAFAMNAGRAQVIGESMEPEYHDGEIVKLEPLAEVVMMNDEGFIDFAAVAKVIKSGGDYLLSLNESGNTIKRIRLEPPGPSGRWALNLVALNRDWADANGYDEGGRMIRRGDSLVIYARVRR